MKKIKCFSVFLAAALFVLNFAGCSGTTDSTEEPENESPSFGEQKELFVSFLIDGKEISEGYTVGDDASHSLSFSYSDSKNANTKDLPLYLQNGKSIFLIQTTHL